MSNIFNVLSSSFSYFISFSNPYIFCRICGKFARKDYFKDRHVKDHPYLQPSLVDYVSHGQYPNRDKFGHFERFLEHFGIEKCSQEE